MLDPKQKLAALQSELQQVAKTYNDAKELMVNCERKILQIQGGISACEDLIKQNEETQEEETQEVS
tara:strand:+ start:341 stop:538 length:198 start_codon:yes stop_codon:yes gene_type:complete